MRELIIVHHSRTGQRTGHVQIGYRANERAQQQWREGSFDFQYDPDDRELLRWYLEDYLQCPWGAFRDRAARAELVMQRLGVELFEAVFQGETRELYDNIRNDLVNSRIVVHAVGTDGVAFPWELLRDPRRENCDLARLAYSFTRSQSNLDYDPPTLEHEGTFNILLVISRPAGENDVPFQSVARRLLAAVRDHRERIRVDVLRPPTFEQLAKELEDHPGFYQALHFDGHGLFPGFEQEGVLLFESESQPRRAVTGGELGQLLTEHRLPLVVLNACQSGTTEAQALYPSIGNQLLRAGVGAVVAMAYSVYVSSAANFVARFYERLAQGHEVARAVHAGRAELFASKLRFSPIGELPLPDWIVPVLFEAGEVRISAPPRGVQLRSLNEVDDAFANFPDAPGLGFIGRDAPFLHLERAFARHTLVLLRGMAGIGKTAAATGFARWFIETAGVEGPAFYFSFEHHLTLTSVCDRIGLAFQTLIKDQGIEWAVQDGTARRNLVLQILRQMPCFLIWDNFETVAGFPTGTSSDWTSVEQSELRDFLVAVQGGRTKVLLSSRREELWLGEICATVELSGLNLRESQELGIEVLRRANLDHHALRELQDYNELLRYLRGNPLAIQAVLSDLKYQTPTGLLTALRYGETNLDGDVSQGRERSLSASLNYRFDQLDAAARRKLGLLGLFQSFVNAEVLVNLGASPSAPSYLQGMSVSDWVDFLKPVAELGLIETVSEGYYFVHPVLPSFLNQLLGEREYLQDQLAYVYFSYGLHLKNEFLIDAQTSVFFLKLEEPNFWHSFRHAKRRQFWDALLGTAYGLQCLLTLQGRWIEFEALLQELVEIEATKDNEEFNVALDDFRFSIAMHKRNFDEATRLQLAMKAYFERSEGEDERLNGSLFHLGNIAFLSGDLESADDWYNQSLWACSLQDSHSRARIYHQMGIIKEKQGQLDEAASFFNKSLELKEEIGDEHGMASTLNQLGNLFNLYAGDVEVAFDHYSRALHLMQEIGDALGTAQVIQNIGNMFYNDGDMEAAEEWFRQSLPILEPIGELHAKAMVLNNLGAIAMSRQNVEEAALFYRNAEQCARQSNSINVLETVQRALLAIESRSE